MVFRTRGIRIRPRLESERANTTISIFKESTILLYFELATNGPHIGPNYELKTQVGTAFRVESDVATLGAARGSSGSNWRQ